MDRAGQVEETQCLFEWVQGGGRTYARAGAENALKSACGTHAAGVAVEGDPNATRGGLKGEGIGGTLRMACVRGKREVKLFNKRIL